MNLGPASSGLSSHSFHFPFAQPRLFLSGVPVSYLKSDSEPGSRGCRVYPQGWSAPVQECPQLVQPQPTSLEQNPPGLSQPLASCEIIEFSPSLCSGCFVSSYRRTGGWRELSAGIEAAKPLVSVLQLKQVLFGGRGRRQDNSSASVVTLSVICM